MFLNPILTGKWKRNVYYIFERKKKWNSLFFLSTFDICYLKRVLDFFFTIIRIRKVELRSSNNNQVYLKIVSKNIAVLLGNSSKNACKTKKISENLRIYIIELKILY